ncbi:MAG: hypothetical protein OEV93_01890 [Candidatus Moranbacteria bacterium]|nr:hypothetical protein [Candidatus Moranbacteria bacterium]
MIKRIQNALEEKGIYLNRRQIALIIALIVTVLVFAFTVPNMMSKRVENLANDNFIIPAE